MIGSSDVSRLTDLESSLSWSYRTCPIYGWPEANGYFSNTLRVGSSGMRQEFRHLTYFNSVTVVFKCAKGREFRRESGVPTVGSPGIHREFQHLTTSL